MPAESLISKDSSALCDFEILCDIQVTFVNVTILPVFQAGLVQACLC